MYSNIWALHGTIFPSGLAIIPNTLLWASRVSLVIQFTRDTFLQAFPVHAHLPHVQVIWYVHDLCSEFPEHCPLQWLCEVVPQHFLRWAVFDHHVPGIYPIIYEIIAHVDMFCTFGTRFLPVLFQ